MQKGMQKQKKSGWLGLNRIYECFLYKCYATHASEGWHPDFTESIWDNFLDASLRWHDNNQSYEAKYEFIMRIGVPKEIKNHEYRVGLIPANVRELTGRGHTVIIEKEAGRAVGFLDEHYQSSGAKIANSKEEVFEQSEMIVKVKEPQPEECKLLKADQIIFCFLHLAANPVVTDLLLKSGAIAFAYETVTDTQGGLPLLTPMSEIAGRLSIQVGARYLEKMEGGRGVLLSGVPGVGAAKVVILGGGVAGTQALRMALGMGADVFVFDNSLKRLRELDAHFESRVNTCFATGENIERHLSNADLIIGAVLVHGGSAPKIVSRALLKKMRTGSVVVDLSIDQGGCLESSRPTTYSDPTYIEEGIVHYCVTNMPASVPRTSATALNNATSPFIISLADKGYREACLSNAHLLMGLNIYKGKITYKAVAEALGKPYSAVLDLI